MGDANVKIGEDLYKWATELFPINRSITGEGVRETLKYIKNLIPDLKINSISSGDKVFDWIIPDEWNVKDAYIESPEGTKIADFKKNNLHLMGYSIPVNRVMSLTELQSHLYSINEVPDAIPYVTSYYNRNWGFCISHNDRKKLPDGNYKVFIDSTLTKGKLNYGEIIIPGKSRKEVLISTYICHPSMANNEVSGIVVTTKLAKWLNEQNNTQYTYRIVFVPETIGSIAYIHRNCSIMKRNVIGGFVVTCVGDNNNYSILNSKYENTLFDKIGNNVIKYYTKNNFNRYSFLDRGSDERQYSSVGVDIPIISLMRTKYGEYNEYHTSLDNLNFISPQGLYGGFEIHKKAIILLENNFIYKVVLPCEPQLGKKGLYPLVSTRETQKQVETMMNFIAYADGKTDLVTIANRINVDALECIEIINSLLIEKVIIRIEQG